MKALDFASLTTSTGVYVLCDLDELPLQVAAAPHNPGGIKENAQYAVVDAESIIVADCQLDVWELAFIWAWPTTSPEQTNELERQIYDHVRRGGTLVAGKALAMPAEPLVDLPPHERTRVRTEEEIDRRRDVRVRLPRQLFQIEQLLDVILDRKDTPDLRASLAKHFLRLHRLHRTFRGLRVSDVADEG